jgi:16S rRNA C967 or C1407 C5-methylase (RsmB/RsmF family)
MNSNRITQYFSKFIDPERAKEITDVIVSGRAPKKVYMTNISSILGNSSSTNLSELLPLFITEDKPLDTDSCYPIDLSSVLLIGLCAKGLTEAENIVDVCSSPGGKGIFLSKYFNPENLVCNETIAKRLGALKDNLKKCQVNATVENQDPADLALQYDEYANLVLLDVPCSAQSVVAKGKSGAGAFLKHVEDFNRKRQRRILATSQGIVKSGGYLAYVTCTFSIKENEDNISWFLKKFPGFDPIKIEEAQFLQSEFTSTPCYRIWPNQGLGCGGFAVLLRKD